jgi:hypothetical protein
MTLRQPPRLAGRLLKLKRLLPAHDIDALLGDIAEEATRRSRRWYWAQLLAVVVVASWRDARRHPWLALRAVATGIATLNLYFGAVMLFGRVVRVLTNGGYYLAGHWLTLPHPLGPPPPYDTLAALVINALGFLASGWAVVRLHRRHGIAMAIPFAVLTTLGALIPLAIVATDTGPGARTMPFLEFITMFGTLFLSIPCGILLGGVLGLRSRRSVRV